MKKLKNFTGAKSLSKNEQREIKGGKFYFCGEGKTCPPDYYCDRIVCKPNALPE